MTAVPPAPTFAYKRGIIISTFFEIKEKHHLPHVHVRYQSDRASIAIEDGMLLAGAWCTRRALP
ncbi:DUF4160 domain-containing protein [Aromatoleum bremense]|uniref:DUF4160 domain-containing protein n=1 Tax=Aromatoleum bremense TaxID=76115 RepID=A0ABX1NWU3_9RHOO|nr:DUF4160 domain-containing protein [Aromatoleum bremense]